VRSKPTSVLRVTVLGVDFIYFPDLTTSGEQGEISLYVAAHFSGFTALAGGLIRLQDH
jgi:hypothetical protein